jgi:hypothetical protein
MTTSQIKEEQKKRKQAKKEKGIKNIENNIKTEKKEKQNIILKNPLGNIFVFGRHLATT